jgi:hypothetical protein
VLERSSGSCRALSTLVRLFFARVLIVCEGPLNEILSMTSGEILAQIAELRAKNNLRVSTIPRRSASSSVASSSMCLRRRPARSRPRVLEMPSCFCRTSLTTSHSFRRMHPLSTRTAWKRSPIAGKFIDVFEEEARKIEAKSAGKVEWFLQGTLYPGKPRIPRWHRQR